MKKTLLILFVLFLILPATSLFAGNAGKSEAAAPFEAPCGGVAPDPWIGPVGGPTDCGGDVVSAGSLSRQYGQNSMPGL